MSSNVDTSIPISIVIPTLEEKEIATTIKYLQQQTVYKQGRAEILLVEYDRRGTATTFLAMKKYLNPLVRIMYVDKPGIAYARHQGIVMSLGSVIVNFDGDAYFTSNKAIERLTHPILNEGFHLTGCDNLFQTRGLTQDQIKSIAVPMTVLDTLNSMQRSPFLPITLEPGMTFSKHAYVTVGGFPNSPMYEGAILGTRIITQMGIRVKKHIPKIAAVVSSRRALGSAADGILNAYGNYQRAYR